MPRYNAPVGQIGAIMQADYGDNQQCALNAQPVDHAKAQKVQEAYWARQRNFSNEKVSCSLPIDLHQCRLPSLRGGAPDCLHASVCPKLGISYHYQVQFARQNFKSICVCMMACRSQCARVQRTHPLGTPICLGQHMGITTGARLPSPNPGMQQSMWAMGRCFPSQENHQSTQRLLHTGNMSWVAHWTSANLKMCAQLCMHLSIQTHMRW
jgi:hypothetical protein